MATDLREIPVSPARTFVHESNLMYNILLSNGKDWAEGKLENWTIINRQNDSE